MLKEGECTYGNLSSANYVAGDFPSHKLVQHISSRSSYDMIPENKGFNCSIDTSGTVDRKIRQGPINTLRLCEEIGTETKMFIKRKDLAETLEVSKTTILNLCPEQNRKSGGDEGTPR